MSRTKWQKVIVAVGVLFMVAYGVLMTWALRMAWTSSRQARVADVVRAQRFELVDPKTGTRARLALLSHGEPALLMNDKNGMMRVQLTLKSDGNPVLSLMDKESTSRATLSLGDDGHPRLGLLDTETEFHVTPGMPREGGCPWLAVSDRKGNFLWKAP